MASSVINNSGTFFYTPDISVAINGDTGPFDVSADIVDFTLQRNINAVSTFTCTLNNPGFKYNYESLGTTGATPIRTMDRITVFMKRTSYVQVFTGFITYAPLLTLVPTPITIQATCTLRILQVTYWDDTLIEYQKLLLNYMDTTAESANQLLNDGGVAGAIVNILYNVCNWNPNNIHIQGIPTNFINFTAQVYNNMISSANGLDQNSVQQLSSIISLDGIANGKSTTNSVSSVNGMENLNGLTPPDNGVGTAFTAGQAKAFVTTGILGNQADFPGKSSSNPCSIDVVNQDIYWCSANFSYLKLTDTKVISDSKTWLSTNLSSGNQTGRLLVVTDTRTNRTVTVRMTSITQDPTATNGSKGNAVWDDEDILQMHPGVVAYLNGSTDDPTTYDLSQATSSLYANIAFLWADSSVSSAGTETNTNQNLIPTNTSASSANQNVFAASNLVSNVIAEMRTQVGVTPYVSGGKSPSTGLDCSGLVYWAWGTQGVTLPGEGTVGEFGSGASADPAKYGTFIPPTTKPIVGDAMFFDLPNDSTKPGHVVTLSIDWGSSGPNGEKAQSGVGWIIEASSSSLPLTGNTQKTQINEQPITWSDIEGGDASNWGGPGAKYLGARRYSTLYGNTGTSLNSNTTTTDTAYNANDASQRSTLSLSNSYNTLFQAPQFDIRSSAIVASPRAFLLDNPVMTDLAQIMGAGLRLYQSAPNGDFVAWFPDYYGIYGTDPVMDISPVEIIDFQIYHDDNQLATHVGIIGDTTGLGQQVSAIDYITTNGIVSIQDTSTMSILFGSYLAQSQANSSTSGPTTTSSNIESVIDFLNRYGMRPFVQEQSMIHSHSVEYLYALQQFMLQWVNQFVSNVQVTFMPEVYPGMRISMTLPDPTASSGNHVYQFYVMGVVHSGSRSGGFTTQLQLTAPMKDGKIMHYGLNLVPTAP